MLPKHGRAIGKQAETIREQQAEIERLRTQVAKLQAAPVWEPVPHGEVFFLPDTEPTADLSRVIVRLTDDLRLCRCTTGQPASNEVR